MILIDVLLFERSLTEEAYDLNRPRSLYYISQENPLSSGNINNLFVRITIQV